MLQQSPSAAAGAGLKAEQSHPQTGSCVSAGAKGSRKVFNGEVAELVGAQAVP